jgi:uncharacterized membrane protein YqjE
MALSAPEDPAPPSAHAPAAGGGLLQSLRALLATLLATVRTRGELLQAELEEERLRVAGIALFAVAGAVFLLLGVLLLSFFLILLFWDSSRVLMAGLLAFAYLSIGAGCALAVRRRSRVKSKLFAASLAELGADGERLRN